MGAASCRINFLLPLLSFPLPLTAAEPALVVAVDDVELFLAKSFSCREAKLLSFLCTRSRKLLPPPLALGEPAAREVGVGAASEGEGLALDCCGEGGDAFSEFSGSLRAWIVGRVGRQLRRLEPEPPDPFEFLRFLREVFLLRPDWWLLEVDPERVREPKPADPEQPVPAPASVSLEWSLLSRRGCLRQKQKHVIVF